ncbi:MAG: MBL fold metallo-hydrolase [Planctomycetes bacterium]|nr:MBL fold metallo-hydrolase [Planctomycetota bacterium]
MELRFYGATGTTTGSCHLIRSEGRSVLLDCGLFQGRREESRKRNERFGFDPQTIDAVVLSHAHIDHSGKLPMLTRQGFAGQVHATRASRDLCAVLLADSAHIQLQDAEFMNRQRWRAARERGEAPPGRHLPRHEVQPLYLEEDVQELMPRMRSHEYGAWFEPLPGMRFRFRDAGHILGSAWVEAEIREKHGLSRLVFTGDYGRFHQPILRDPEPLSEADVLISESTYGNRKHPPFQDLEGELRAAVERLEKRGRGRLLIPAFAVGRTQNILYDFARLCRAGSCPNVRFVVDSPLATAATRIVYEHPECFDAEALAQYRTLQEENSFRSRLVFTHSVEESKALNDDPRPTVLISASGMMESGRILHHLAWNVSSPEAEILIVGYQAEHTLGRRLLEGASEVRIFGMMHRVRARVTPMLGFSAHADRDELLAALVPVAGRARALFLVHGENDQRAPLAEELRRSGFQRVEMPEGPERYRVP